jgi:hypothetical protein
MTITKQNREKAETFSLFCEMAFTHIKHTRRDILNPTESKKLFTIKHSPKRGEELILHSLKQQKSSYISATA